jgi:hypothetical protein
MEAANFLYLASKVKRRSVRDEWYCYDEVRVTECGTAGLFSLEHNITRCHHNKDVCATHAGAHTFPSLTVLISIYNYRRKRPYDLLMRPGIL